MKKILVIIVLFITCLWVPKKTLAQQVSLSLSPPLTEATIQPDRSISLIYTLTNSVDPAILKATVLPFSAKDNTGTINLKDEFDGPIRFNLENTDTHLGQPFILRSKETRKIILNARVPEGAPEGDYYYTFIVQSTPPSTVEGNASIKAKITVGGNILMTVTKTGIIEIKPKLTIFDVLPAIKFSFFGNKYNIIDSFDAIPLVVIVDNHGKNAIKAEGTITLKGSLAGTATYGIPSQTILAQSQRRLSAGPSAVIDCKNDRSMKACQDNVSLVLQNFFIGKYTLSTDIKFGPSSPKIFGTTTFIALPIKLIGSGLLISGLLFFLSKTPRNKKKETHTHEEKSETSL